MLRVLVALLAITSSGAQQADCALDSARAVDDIMDGMVYVFASIVRCDPSAHDEVRCTLDVSAAIESVNKMVNIIVKAVDKCGAITTEKPQCGIAVGELTRSMAGLTTASAGIIAKCPNALNHGVPMDTVGSAMGAAAANTAAGGAGEAANEVGGGFSNNFGQCILNVKDSVKSLFKAIKRTMLIKDDCAVPGSDECAHNAVKLVDGFVGLAQYIAGAVAKCSANVQDDVNGGCAQMSASLMHATGEVGVAGTGLAAACAPTEAERLYLDGLDNKKSVVPAPATNSLTMTLTALLPITAVVAFVGGKRLAKVRAVEPLHDEEMLMQNE